MPSPNGEEKQRLPKLGIAYIVSLTEFVLITTILARTWWFCNTRELIPP